MLACAAVAGWARLAFEKRPTLRPTHVAEYFLSGLEKDIAAAHSSIGEQGAAWSLALPIPTALSPLGIEGYESYDRVHYDWTCDLRLPWAKRFEFRNELNRRILSQLKQGQPGDHISTSEFLGGNQAALPDVSGDGTQYHCGTIHGALRVYLARIDENHTRLIATINEWQSR